MERGAIRGGIAKKPPDSASLYAGYKRNPPIFHRGAIRFAIAPYGFNPRIALPP
jgi:hypothetical protein